MEQIWNENNKRLPWFVSKIWRFIIADLFEKFRNNSLKNYGLFPSHYLRALALSLDAMLNMIKVELELAPDPDMYIFFEKGTRGGVSYISNRYSKASNK